MEGVDSGGSARWVDALAARDAGTYGEAHAAAAEGVDRGSPGWLLQGRRAWREHYGARLEHCGGDERAALALTRRDAEALARRRWDAFLAPDTASAAELFERLEVAKTLLVTREAECDEGGPVASALEQHVGLPRSESTGAYLLREPLLVAPLLAAVAGLVRADALRGDALVAWAASRDRAAPAPAEREPYPDGAPLEGRERDLLVGGVPEHLRPAAEASVAERERDQPRLWEERGEERREVDLGHGVSVRLAATNARADGVGSRVWSSGYVLAAHLAAHPAALVAGRDVLELGGGVGVLGLAAARLGARRVVLTDYLPSLVALLEENARLSPADGAPVSAALLDWNDDLAEALRDAESAGAAPAWDGASSRAAEADVAAVSECQARGGGACARLAPGETFGCVVASDCLYTEGMTLSLAAAFRRRLAPGGVGLLLTPLRRLGRADWWGPGGAARELGVPSYWYNGALLNRFVEHASSLGLQVELDDSFAAFDERDDAGAAGGNGGGSDDERLRLLREYYLGEYALLRLALAPSPAAA